MVVLAERPATRRSIKGNALATTSAIAAATVSARVRSRDPDGSLASKRPQRAQAALPPGASGGICCNKSQSGQATDGGGTLTSKAQSPSDTRDRTDRHAFAVNDKEAADLRGSQITLTLKSPPAQIPLQNDSISCFPTALARGATRLNAHQPGFRLKTEMAELDVVVASRTLPGAAATRKVTSSTTSPMFSDVIDSPGTW